MSEQTPDPEIIPDLDDIEGHRFRGGSPADDMLDDVEGHGYRKGLSAAADATETTDDDGKDPAGKFRG